MKCHQMEHPSAITSFDQMVSKAKGKSIVVFLDYDGTLSPIVDDPDLAFMSDEVHNLCLLNLTLHPKPLYPLLPALILPLSYN